MDTIYFFTGSGNSFATARMLARKLGETQLMNMAVLLGCEEIKVPPGLVGLVYPVYGSLPPKPVREFLAALRFYEETHFFAVCTCGLAPGHGLIKADQILKKSGGVLSWGFAIMQPQSGVGSKRLNTPEVLHDRYTAQKEKVEQISCHIKNNEPAVIEKSGRFSEFFNRSTLKVLPTIFKLIGHLITKGMKNMTFHADLNCDGCGICARLCPAGNIVMKEGLPQWEDNCLGCMGCYHWCPRNAVKNVDLDMVQTPHPDVDMADLLSYAAGKPK